jgi:Ca2+-binding EF-hand superfamily protein
MTKLSDDRKKDILNYFKKHDKDNSGYLDRKELRLALNELNKIFVDVGLGLSLNELEDMMTNADRNGDGRVNYREFVNIELVKLI